MEHAANTILCDGCGAEITWAPVVKRSPDQVHLLRFCCPDCLAGLECACGERMELEEERRAGAPAVNE